MNIDDINRAIEASKRQPDPNWRPIFVFPSLRAGLAAGLLEHEFIVQPVLPRSAA